MMAVFFRDGFIQSGGGVLAHIADGASAFGLDIDAAQGFAKADFDVIGLQRLLFLHLRADQRAGFVGPDGLDRAAHLIGATSDTILLAEKT